MHKYVKAAGLKSEKEFYSKFPTPEDFFNTYPKFRDSEKENKFQYGGLFRKWNKFQGWLEKKDLVGKKSMDRGPSKTKKYLDDYKKENPKSDLTEEDVKVVQTIYKELGLPVSNKYSKPDKYIGSITSTYRFPDVADRRIEVEPIPQSYYPKGVSMTPIYDSKGYSLLGMQGNDGNFYKPQNMDEQTWAALAPKLSSEYVQPILDRNFGRGTYTFNPKMEGGGNVQQAFTSGVPNVEVEGKETIITPDGLAFEAKGPSHAEGGIEMNLPKNGFVLSESLKAPEEIVRQFFDIEKDKKLTKEQKKMSFADMGNKFNTEKDIVNANSKDKFKSLTASLNIANKNNKLDELKLAQERYKFGLGIDNNFESLMSDQLPKARLGLDMGDTPFNKEKIEKLKASGKWGLDYWNSITEEMRSLDPDIPIDPIEAQAYISKKYPELVANSFKNTFTNPFPLTNKGLNTFGNVSSETLTDEQLNTQFVDQLPLHRNVKFKVQNFNNADEYGKFISQQPITSNNRNFYADKEQTGSYIHPQLNMQHLPLTNYTTNPTPTTNPEFTTNPTPTTNPEFTTNPFLVNNQLENPEEDKDNTVWKELDLSKIRNANAAGLLSSGLSSIGKVNYPTLMPNMPAPNYTRAFDIPQVQQTQFNNQMSQQLASINNSNLSEIEKQALASNLYAKAMSNNNNSINAASTIQNMNQNYGVMNQYNQQAYGQGIRLLDKYNREVDMVNANKARVKNQMLKNHADYNQKLAESDTYLPLALEQSGMNTKVDRNGNIQYSVNDMNAKLYRQLLQYQSLLNKQKRNSP